MSTSTATTSFLIDPVVASEVTRHNFHDALAAIAKDLNQSSCRFVAIDTEFTGLAPSDNVKEKYLDTLEARYNKVKQSGENFLITQFGIAAVHIEDAIPATEEKPNDNTDNVEEKSQVTSVADDESAKAESTSTKSKVHQASSQRVSIKCWNFYVFPRPYLNMDMRFLCQASSMQFMSDHGFDFNKFIRDGIPYMTYDAEARIRKKHAKSIESVKKDAPRNLTITGEADQVMRITLIFLLYEFDDLIFMDSIGFSQGCHGKDC